jgi:hypothetical protein
MLLSGLLAALALVGLNVWLYLTFRRTTRRRNPVDVAPPCDESCPTCAALDEAERDHEAGSFSDKLR